jgi:hypothetical protein
VSVRLPKFIPKPSVNNVTLPCSALKTAEDKLKLLLVTTIFPLAVEMFPSKYGARAEPLNVTEIPPRLLVIIVLFKHADRAVEFPVDATKLTLPFPPADTFAIESLAQTPYVEDLFKPGELPEINIFPLEVIILAGLFQITPIPVELPLPPVPTTDIAPFPPALIWANERLTPTLPPELVGPTPRPLRLILPPVVVKNTGAAELRPEKSIPGSGEILLGKA